MDGPKQQIGGTIYRPICKQVHQPTGLLRFAVFCIPPNLHHGERNRQDSTREWKGADIGSTFHTPSALVPFLGTNGGKQTTNSPGGPNSTSASLQTRPSKPRHAVFDGVLHSLPRLDAQGYSPSVVNHLTKARTKTTNLTYNSEWLLF